MIYIAIALFALAAVLGLLNLKYVIQKNTIPRPIVYLHGLFAASGLVLLIIYAIQNMEHRPLASIILFVIAALGGFYLFARDLAKKTIPLSVAGIHALVAVAGFLMLLIFAFSK